MTTMITELYDALKAAGAPEDKARRAAETVATREELVTRTDLAAVRTELKADIAATRAELAAVRTELKADLAGLEAELAGLRAEMRAMQDRIILRLVLAMIGVAGLAVTLARLV
jgi:multidrug resistance efflux pump